MNRGSINTKRLQSSDYLSIIEGFASSKLSFEQDPGQECPRVQMSSSVTELDFA
jgi:hypothetical protein